MKLFCILLQSKGQLEGQEEFVLLKYSCKEENKLILIRK